jgi:hypothetical protein
MNRLTLLPALAVPACGSNHDGKNATSRDLGEVAEHLSDLRVATQAHGRRRWASASTGWRRRWPR